MEPESREVPLEDEAAFARKFARLNEGEKFSLLYNWKRGDETQFKELLRDALIIHEVWDEFCKSIGDWCEGGDEFVVTVRSVIDVEFENDRASFEWPDIVLHPVVGHIQQLFDWFEPTNSEFASVPCVEEWKLERNPGFQVKLGSPTAHERLEAMLRWHEWVNSIESSNK